MASLVLSGDTSGSITVSAPAVAGSNTQTLVATTGTLAPIVSGTAQNSTSGTSIDFTGIPSWVKRITVMFNGVSAVTSPFQIQIGSGSIDATGYLNGASWGGSGNTSYSTTGFSVTASGVMAAGSTYSGQVILSTLGSNIWSEFGILAAGSSVGVSMSAGSKTLSGTLDRVRITTVNGTDTFDAGSINILYE